MQKSVVKGGFFCSLSFLSDMMICGSHSFKRARYFLCHRNCIMPAGLTRLTITNKQLNCKFFIKLTNSLALAHLPMCANALNHCKTRKKTRKTTKYDTDKCLCIILIGVHHFNCIRYVCVFDDVECVVDESFNHYGIMTCMMFTEWPL